jgi:hypothetical protein
MREIVGFHCRCAALPPNSMPPASFFLSLSFQHFSHPVATSVAWLPPLPPSCGSTTPTTCIVGHPVLMSKPGTGKQFAAISSTRVYSLLLEEMYVHFSGLALV